jgi:hypothetical protein
MLNRIALSIVNDTTTRAQAFRTRYGIPSGAVDVALVQDNAVCEAVTATVQASGTVPFSEALVVVRVGQTNPVYTAMERRNPPGGGLVYLLDAQFSHLATIGGQ